MMAKPRGPTWEELEDWCRHDGVDFERMKRHIIRRTADREAKRALDEMLRLVEEAKGLTGADWLANQRLWDEAHRDHNRAMDVAYPPRDQP
jgi:hypothetical protein